ncbi:MAG: hypothetical protein BroJett003_18540 [Planctomycetota bacterium]|nr:MAG: hypothetical protein BroJett003_18540 [Planctomycetota bacterium]
MRSRMLKLGRALFTVAAGAAVLSGSCNVGLDGVSVFLTPGGDCCDDGYFEFGGSFYEEEYYYDDGFYEDGYYEEEYYYDDGYYFP